jgi:hypothetical protein
MIDYREERQTQEGHNREERIMSKLQKLPTSMMPEMAFSSRCSAYWAHFTFNPYDQKGKIISEILRK